MTRHRSSCSGSRSAAITEDTSLLENDLLNSLDFLELVTFIEEQFEVTLHEDTMTPDNFETPKLVAALIESTK